jgi:dynein intermediate chain 1
VKPDNQLDLSPEELKTEITRVLTGDDPNRPKNITKFNYKELCYKLDPPGLSDHMAVHFVLESVTLHVDSKEYKLQQQVEERKREAGKEGLKTQNESGTGSTSQSVCKSKNQFNFSDRASQTLNNTLKSRYVCTEPPPVAQYSANISQWQIHDSYVSELVITNMEHADVEFERNMGQTDTGNDSSDEEEVEEKFGVISENMAKSLKIVERLVNQNSQDEMYQDFKYWEDVSDEYRQGEGSLLPLWRFAYERTRKKQVTALCWNPKHSDLFAVGYGSYNFLQQGSGLVCCYSIKNASYPEYIFPTESGVLSLDFHPQYPSLLVVGCYDGSVHVYDISSTATKPIYSSTISTGQHNDPVWQVNWQKEEPGKDLNFYSISSDGNVYNWSMSKNELDMEPVIQLKFIPSANHDSEEATITGLASGCCFDFNLNHDHLFLVGTEEGNIHKCSKSYSGQYLQTYSGHHMAVYAVQWNTFHDDLFVSCSADWTVKVRTESELLYYILSFDSHMTLLSKLWDHKIGYALLSLDLGNAVGDVVWSPHSSTIFSAVTSDGKVHVYDLYENKQDPLCVQKVVKRARLTKASFSTSDHILIVGDDKGGVNSLKLSPNLRKLHLPDQVQEDDDKPLEIDVAKVQRDKMEKLRSTLLTAGKGKNYQKENIDTR